MSYINNINKIEPLTIEKVITLSKKEYNIEVSNKSTSSSIFSSIVIDNILKLNEADTKVALSLCCLLGSKFYDVVTSKDMFYTKIRKPILEEYGKNSKQYKETLDLMKITKEERTKLTLDYKAKVRNSNKERKTYYSEDLLKIIEETKDSDDWAQVSIGLMLSSGTRPIELLNKNNFKVDPSKDNTHVIVSGIAKKRKGKEHIVTTRPIIGYTAIDFVEAVNKFRKSIFSRILCIETGSNQGQLKKSNTSLISSRLNKYFPNDPEITPKTLRKLYGNLAYVMYGETQNLNVFLGSVLSHDENDLETSFSYSTLIVVLGKSAYFKPLLITKSKIQIVKDTIERMVKDGESISQEKVICASGISWRVVRSIVGEYKKGLIA